MTKNNQGGFTLIESIFIIALMVGLAFVVYHFGWGTSGEAEVEALQTDIKTMQTAVGAYILKSNGLYPTNDSKLPEAGEYKLIMWDSSFASGGQRLSFYPDFIKRLPRHWNEGVWRIDSGGRVLATTDPEGY